MDMEKFKRDLDELFRLFNKLMDKQEDEMMELPGFSKAMLEQFKFFFSNYENMKDQIALQLQGQFGEPVGEMVEGLIKQLREELGEEEWMVEPATEDAVEIPPVPEKAITDVNEEIAKIDKLLQNPNLTPEQVDELLDRRSKLK
jgi:hypothetical protein